MTRKEAGYRKKTAEIICNDIIRSYLKDNLITIEVAGELSNLFKTLPDLSDDEMVNIVQDVYSELCEYLRKFPDIQDSFYDEEKKDE